MKAPVVEDWRVQKRETYRGHEIEVWLEEYVDPIYNPRDWDNLGHMVYAHRNYQLGDEQLTTSQINHIRHLYGEGISGLEAWAVEERDAEVILTLFLYDHSMQSISTRSFVGRAHHARWDSGPVGIIYATKEDILKEYSRKRMSKQLREKVEGVLRSEVEVFDSYIKGELYGFTILDPEGRELETMGGYLGDDFEYIIAEAKHTIDYVEDRRE